MTRWVTRTELRRALASAKRVERAKRRRLADEAAALRRERTRHRLRAARSDRDAESARRESAKLRDELARERAMWSTREDGASGWEMGRAPEDEDAMSAHTREILDGVIRNEKLLHDMTGMSRDKFGFLLRRFEKRAARNAGGRTPLFRGAVRRASKAGMRMRLPMRHVLLLALCHYRSGSTQYQFEAVCGISQPTISRYLAFAGTILTAILPTPDRITAKLAAASLAKEFKQLVPGHNAGVLIVDGTQVERQRPGVKEERDKSFGSKFHMHSYLNLVCTNSKGVLLWMSRTVHGRTNEFKFLCREEPDFGKWTSRLRAESAPRNRRFTMIFDLGFQGVAKVYPAQNVLIGIKRKPGKELTDEEKEWNDYVGSRRAFVEHGIGRAKFSALVRGPIRGENRKFRKKLIVAAGIANFHMLWGTIRKNSWVGKTL